MPSRNTSTAAKWLLACGVSLLSTVAMASLKDKPPKGVALSGLWQLDPYRSDDAGAVLKQARADTQEKSYSRAGGGRRGGGGGGYGHGGGHHRSQDSSGSSQDDSNSTSTSNRGQMLTDLVSNPNTLDFS